MVRCFCFGRVSRDDVGVSPLGKVDVKGRFCLYLEWKIAKFRTGLQLFFIHHVQLSCGHC